MVAQALIVTKRLTTLDFLNDDIDSGGPPVGESHHSDVSVARLVRKKA